MVEINITSNDLILGVSGKNHPLPIYRESGVPVALSTDDEGVSRIEPATPCTRESLGADKPSSSCAAFLKSSDKAQQQWKLERRFRLWESAH